MYTHRLTEAIHAFCEAEMTKNWTENVCKSATVTDTAVLLLIELVTGRAWLAPALRRRLTSFLQLQASDKESKLTDLWIYMSEALQVKLPAGGKGLCVGRGFLCVEQGRELTIDRGSVC